MKKIMMLFITMAVIISNCYSNTSYLNENNLKEISTSNMEEKDIVIEAANKKMEKYKIPSKVKYTWNVQSVHASKEKKSYCEKNRVKVAVLDSGIDSTEDYNVKQHVNFVEEEKDIDTLYEDRTGHGTSIAGIISGNKTEMKGINPNAELYSLKVLDEHNKSTVSRVVDAIYWCIDNRINIINMSFGTDTNSEMLHNAIKEAYKNNILMVAAVGNNGKNIQYPAAYKEVMSVGSVNSQNEISDFSYNNKNVDILAPGELIESYGGFGEYIVASGTSMAVPHVVGVASVLLSKEPECDTKFIRKLIKDSSRKIENKENGIVDLDYALQIYEVEKEAYKNGDLDYEVKENTNELITYNTEGLVEGQWGADGHTNSVDKGYKMTNIYANKQYEDMTIIRKLVNVADSKNFNGVNLREIGALHGSYNYVANLKYLFNVAKKTKNGNSVDNAIKAITYADLSYTKENGDRKASEIVKDLNTAIKTIVKEGENNSEKCKCILALAFHLAGDIYAHESMVPKNSIQNVGQGVAFGENIIVSGSYFDGSQFTNSKYKEMCQIITKGSLKFSKIKKYQKVESGKYYEDNTNFYSSRYNRATAWAISSMLDDMYDSKDYFSIWTLEPELYCSGGYGIKRFRLYTLAKRCKLSMDSDDEKCLKNNSYDS